MTKQEQLAWKSKYPEILRDLGGDSSKTCMSWRHGGIAVGPGWMGLLDELFSFLQFHTDKNGYGQVIAVQIKEKFGGLRFYYEVEGDQKDKYGYPRSNDFLEGAISFAEYKSYKTCKECGATGKLRGSGFKRVLCKKCEEKSLN